MIQTPQHTRSADNFEEAVKLSPDEASVQNGLGMALFALRRYKKAVAAFTRAIELNPNFDAARFNLALTYLADKNKTDALRQYFVIRDSNEDYARRLYKIIYRDKVSKWTE